MKCLPVSTISPTNILVVADTATIIGSEIFLIPVIQSKNCNQSTQKKIQTHNKDIIKSSKEKSKQKEKHSKFLSSNLAKKPGTGQWETIS